jgi:hypothetical protein
VFDCVGHLMLSNSRFNVSLSWQGYRVFSVGHRMLPWSRLTKTPPFDVVVVGVGKDVVSELCRPPNAFLQSILHYSPPRRRWTPAAVGHRMLSKLLVVPSLIRMYKQTLVDPSDLYDRTDQCRSTRSAWQSSRFRGMPGAYIGGYIVR